MLDQAGARLAEVLGNLNALGAERQHVVTTIAELNSRLVDLDARIQEAQVGLTAILVEHGDAFIAAVEAAKSAPVA